MRAWVVLLLVAGCAPSGPQLEDPDEIPLKVAQRCPGDATCLAGGGDGKLYAAAAKRDITPPVETFTDLNANELWDEGEPFVDANGNGVFDTYYIAGYKNGRLAYGVHDPIWVRAWVLKRDNITIAFFTADVLGLFYDELKLIRTLIDPALGIDLVVMSATHNHEAPDSVGGWGKDQGENGIHPEQQARIRQGAVDAITEAMGKLVPVRMTAGSIAVEGPDGDLTHLVGDTRDPAVIDNRMHVLRFDGLDDDKPVVTVVNWSAHPEGAGSKNHQITSDFVTWVRSETEKSGGEVVYVSGSVGGQIGPGRVQPIADDGSVVTQSGLPFAEAWGKSVARFVPRALDASQGGHVVVEESPALSFVTTKYNVHVDNLRYLVAGQIGVFNRPFFGFDKKKPISGANAPLIDTETAYLRIGEQLSIITVSGELLPELFVGGYDGSMAHNWPFIDTTQPNAPNPALAPKAPYLIDHMDGHPQHRMVFGLTMDFLGYIVPKYNWAVDGTAPYIREALGDHYEETNSVGPRAAPEIIGTARQLVLDAKQHALELKEKGTK
jgi:hypothetical protein